MKRNFLVYLIIVVALTSCARQCQSFEKNFQTGSRNYEVIMYSGGDTVYYDKFKGIINDSKGSDGAYYSKGDTLIEISGDYIIKSTD